MVDKITKALNKFSKTEKRVVKKILLKIKSGKFSELNLKKLKGRNDIYRVRKGKLRVIYRIKDQKIYLISIERRNDRTYKDF